MSKRGVALGPLLQAEPSGQDLGKKASESDGKVKKKARVLAMHETLSDKV